MSPSELPPQISVLPPPTTIAEAVRSIHHAGEQMLSIMARLERFALREQQAPEMRVVAINPGNNGQYQVVDRAAWAAKSIGILNPGAAPVFLGIGGVSARPGSRAPSIAGASAMTLPVEAEDLELGCDSAVLGSATAVVYLFRYVTVQPLALGPG